MPPKRRKLHEPAQESKSPLRVHLEDNYEFNDTLTPSFNFKVGHIWCFLIRRSVSELISLLLRVYTDDCSVKSKLAMRTYIVKLQKSFKKHVHNRAADRLKRFKQECESTLLWPTCVVMKDVTTPPNHAVELMTFSSHDQQTLKSSNSEAPHTFADDQQTATCNDTEMQLLATTSCIDERSAVACKSDTQPTTSNCDSAMSSLCATPAKTMKQDPIIMARNARRQLWLKNEELKTLKIKSKIDIEAATLSPNIVRNIKEKLKRRDKFIITLKKDRTPMQKSLINMKRRLQYATTQKRPTAPKKDLTAELHESENARLQLEEELVKLKQQSVLAKKEGKFNITYA